MLATGENAEKGFASRLAKETVDKWAPRIAYFFFCVAFLLWIALSSQLNNARPTDDMFYIDAGWRLSHGQYQPPTQHSPFHHYLRWPVILPLGALQFLFGTGSLTIKLFGLLHIFIAGGALLLILRKLAPSKLLPLAGSAAILLVPFELLSPRVLSEPVACAWFMAGAAIIVLTGEKRHWLPLALGGACVALAINAAQVIVFSAPIIWYLAYISGPRSPNWPREVFLSGLWPALGAIGMYAVIIAGEWIAFGDPLIEIKTISMWHLKSLQHEQSYLTSLFDQQNANYIFGYTARLFDQYPAFSISLIAMIGVAIAGRTSRYLPLIICGFIGMATLEFFSPLVVDKIYLRFASVPIAFLTVGSCAGFVEALSNSRSRPTAVLASGVICIGTYFSTANNYKAMVDDEWTAWLRPAFAAVVDTAQSEDIPADKVVLVVGDPDIPGLIPWVWAANVYTGYRYNDSVRHTPMTEWTDPANSDERDLVHFLVTANTTISNDAQEAGYSAIRSIPGPHQRELHLLVKKPRISSN